jgi:hypothetical protein
MHPRIIPCLLLPRMHPLPSSQSSLHARTNVLLASATVMAAGLPLLQSSLFRPSLLQPSDTHPLMHLAHKSLALSLHLMSLPCTYSVLTSRSPQLQTRDKRQETRDTRHEQAAAGSKITLPVLPEGGAQQGNVLRYPLLPVPCACPALAGGLPCATPALTLRLPFAYCMTTLCVPNVYPPHPQGGPEDKCRMDLTARIMKDFRANQVCSLSPVSSCVCAFLHFYSHSPQLSQHARLPLPASRLSLPHLLTALRLSVLHHSPPRNA